MSEMVERVARALEERAKASPYEFVPQDGPCAGAFGLNFSAFARAAIEAMREPTKPVAKAMIGAMEERIEMFYDPYDPGRHFPDEGDVADVMNAFVDTALKP